MHTFFSSFFENKHIKTTLSIIKRILAPFLRIWNFIFSPIRRLFSPITNWWSGVTAPFNARWDAYTKRNPISGSIGSLLGKLVKYGFNTVLFLVFGVWIGLFGRLPSTSDLRKIETSQTTEVYSADSVLIGKYFIENRTTVSLKDISEHVINALIATEDKRFFEHSGIDFMSWLRIMKGVVTQTEGLGGGSTLSQQLAKNLYPRKNYYIPGISIFLNKLRENFISIRLERVYKKDDLLNMYLNTVPFGADRFGISVASKFFFNKKPKDLNPSESATLVGMLKASTAYDPIRNPEKSQIRRNLVLRQMIKNKHLTEKEYDELSKKPINAKKYNREGSNDGNATYFREYLRSEVLPKMLKNYTKEDGSSYNLYTDGLKIYTTLHSKMQTYAEEAVSKHMQTLQKQFDQHWKGYKKDRPWGDDKWIDEQIRKSDRWDNLKGGGMNEEGILKNFAQPTKMSVYSWKNGGSEQDTVMAPIDSVRYYFCLLQCGFLAMDHRNGYIRAWVGGTNFKYFKYDHVRSSRQVGSTFKPIVYAAALQDSMKPCDYISNKLVKIKDWEPHNADEKYGGWYSMTGALKNSVNVVAAKLIERVGIEKTIQLAKKMGVTSKLPREFGISLGAADISLYDMIQVYGTIANKGVRPDPVLVTHISTREGKVLFNHKEEEKLNPTLRDSALTEEHAAMMRRMMQGVLDSGGTGSRFRKAHGIQGDFAGKTGTTQNQTDGWFICFNPQLVTGTWVGGESPAVRFRAMYLGQGSASALPIVAWFWYKMANDKKLSKMLWEKFSEPKNDISNYFGCASRIWHHPDSAYLYNKTDSLSLPKDTTRLGNVLLKAKEDLSKLFGKNKTDDPYGDEKEKIEKEKRKAEKQEQKEERKEKRKDFFDKILGRKEEGGN
jgi:penicillin-binding protein 1A